MTGWQIWGLGTIKEGRYKDTIKKLYNSFSNADMDTMMSLLHDDAQGIINGMHRFSGTYDKFQLSGTVAQIPVMFDEFKVQVDEIIEEGDSAFVTIKGTAVGMSADFGYFDRFKDGKIIEQWIIDECQKMAHAMRTMQRSSNHTRS